MAFRSEFTRNKFLAVCFDEEFARRDSRPGGER